MLKFRQQLPLAGEKQIEPLPAMILQVRFM